MIAVEASVLRESYVEIDRRVQSFVRWLKHERTGPVVDGILNVNGGAQRPPALHLLRVVDRWQLPVEGTICDHDWSSQKWAHISVHSQASVSVSALFLKLRAREKVPLDGRPLLLALVHPTAAPILTSRPPRRSAGQVSDRLTAHVRFSGSSRSPCIHHPLFISHPRVALARRCAFAMCTATRRQEEMPQSAHTATEPAAGVWVKAAIWVTRISGLSSV